MKAISSLLEKKVNLDQIGGKRSRATPEQNVRVLTGLVPRRD